MSSQNMEASKINKYSVRESSVPGTFYQNIPVYDIHEKSDSLVGKADSFKLNGYQEYRIDRLSEKEKMEGWIRVLPNFVVREEEVFINNEKVKVRRKIRDLTHLSLNLSQLPDYLWKRMKTKYIDKRFVGYTVKDKIYRYKVYATEVDEQIRILRKLLKSHNMNGKNKGKIKKLLKEINNKVDKNFEKGWIILKAESV
jgi:hypothetical protein